MKKKENTQEEKDIKEILIKDKKENERLLKLRINEIKDMVKRFKKVSKRDLDEGLKLAKELKIKINEIIKFKDVKDKIKLVDYEKTLQGLDIYMENGTKILEFKKKWN